MLIKVLGKTFQEVNKRIFKAQVENRLVMGGGQILPPPKSPGMRLKKRAKEREKRQGWYLLHRPLPAPAHLGDSPAAAHLGDSPSTEGRRDLHGWGSQVKTDGGPPGGSGPRVAHLGLNS